jgi:hypothetical protein
MNNLNELRDLFHSRLNPSNESTAAPKVVILENLVTISFISVSAKILLDKFLSKKFEPNIFSKYGLYFYGTYVKAVFLHICPF